MNELKSWVRRRGLEPALRPLHAMAQRAVAHLRGAGEADALRQAPLVRRLHRIAGTPEGSEAEIEAKLALVGALAEGTFHRCHFWREIARLERRRGNVLLAATYEIRMMRLLGADRFGHLPGVVAALHDLGSPAVADILQAQHGPDASPAALRAALDAREAAFRANPVEARTGCAVIDDRRRNLAPVVSIIVSLYDAAAKLPHFLAHLERQGLVRAGGCEIIFIDANSPSAEQAAVEAHIDALKNDFLFVRTQARETIQAAWNRALGFARGRYVTCLGVDEGLLPDALEHLAARLDADPSLDWVMANSLVTEVDADGRHVRDVMTYDRRGARKESAYLDTTYVSWVGGLYRRDIHDRFGYYDPSFRAAGDTEFKMRVLRWLKIAFVDRTLGVFFNYPEARTTVSPIAEVEDALAWYAYRSEGGAGYLLDGEDDAVARAVLIDALGYRKAYARHVSTDVAFAAAIARRLMNSDDVIAAVSADLSVMMDDLRALEHGDTDERVSVADGEAARARARWARIEERHARLLNRRGQLVYAVSNDNRYEQHAWVWRL